MSEIPALTREARIKRELRLHLKNLGFVRGDDGTLQPPGVTKECFRVLHLQQRNERLKKSADFIFAVWPRHMEAFANGSEVEPSLIRPRLEVVRSGTWQSEVFRLACLTWSVPVSNGYGRRLRFLVWDEHAGRLMGVIALGDPVFNLRARDSHVGWNVQDRVERLTHTMDAYVLGAIPPYNMLLCGKLVACLVRTTDVRDFFAAKYGKAKGLISGIAKQPRLVLVTTTSSLGRSAIYNRLKLANILYFRPVGYTMGWGHFHVPDRLFAEMREYLLEVGDTYSANHRFGDGPNWRLRAIRKTLTRLGLRADLLRHGIKREVFVCDIASNANQFLCGVSRDPEYVGLPSAAEVGEQAVRRWVIPRSQRDTRYQLWVRDQLFELLKPQNSVLACDSAETEVRNGTGKF